MYNLIDTNFVNWFIIRLSIKFFANRLELDISIFKTDFFRKDIIFRIATAGNIDYAIVFLKKILFIVFDCSTDSLFNTGKNIFNRKRIIDILCQKFRSLDYNNYYISYFFCRNTVTETRNSDISETIIILLDYWKSDIYFCYIEINFDLILQTLRCYQSC